LLWTAWPVRQGHTAVGTTCSVIEGWGELASGNCTPCLASQLSRLDKRVQSQDTPPIANNALLPDNTWKHLRKLNKVVQPQDTSPITNNALPPDNTWNHLSTLNGVVRSEDPPIQSRERHHVQLNPRFLASTGAHKYHQYRGRIQPNPRRSRRRAANTPDVITHAFLVIPDAVLERCQCSRN